MSSTTIYEYGVTTSGSGDFKINHPGAPNAGIATIESLVAGDQFAFEGKTYTYAGGADLGGPGGTQVGFFAYAPNGNLQFFSLNENNVNLKNQSLYLNTSQGETICFCAGTRIATPAGPVAVEELRIGQLVSTADGGSAPVLWVGRQTVSTVFGDPQRVLPIRIRAGALEDNLPQRDLLVSPCHALLVDGVLVQVGALVNGRSIVREDAMPSVFTYYHVETEAHALVLAEGVAAETFIDNVGRQAFDNWAEHEALYPDGRAIPELPYPRAAAARQVPAALAARLQQRAHRATGVLRQAA